MSAIPLTLLAEVSPWHVKAAVAVLLLLFFWGWETWRPFHARGKGRLPHAGHNLAVALLNTTVLALLFGTATVAVAEWTSRNEVGLLHALGLAWPWRLALALVLLDGWMYVWHRANHAVPLLWRFHRVHHADDRMDVTTATRFHLGEHAGSALLRLGLIPLVGFEFWHLVLYDTLVLAVTMFHHADISLGRCNRPLRWLLVTPFMHKVHHSRRLAETNSNYATILSLWDRLARTFRTRPDPEAIAFGLDGLDAPRWQTVGGMLRLPFVTAPAEGGESIPRGKQDAGADRVPATSLR